MWGGALALLVYLAPTPLLSSGPGAGSTIRVERVPSRTYRDYLSDDSTWSLLGPIKNGWDDGYVSRWKAAPRYLQLSACEHFLDGLTSAEKCIDLAFQWQPSLHDMRRRAGRAARFFEEALGLRLPAVGPDTTAAELAALHRTAAEAVDRFRARALAATDWQNRSVESLRRKYQGRIRPGINGSADENWQSVDALDDLLREWCLIGQRVEALEQIVGIPLQKAEQEGSFRYSFRQLWCTSYVNGRPVKIPSSSGARFTFVTEKGIIKRVDMIYLGC
jgi:hypothetical protein